MARSFFPRRRKRRSSELRSSVRLSLLLVGLTAVNVYVFFVRDDTSVKKLMQPSSTGKLLEDEKRDVVKASASLPPTGTAPKGARPPASAGASTGSAPGLQKSSAASAPATPAAGAGEGRTIEGTIGPDETLGAVLAREGLGQQGPNVIKALSRLLDPRTIRPGDRYELTLDPENQPQSFEYLPSPVLRYIVTPAPEGGWIGRKEETPLVTKQAEASGVIESSLYESIYRAKETGALVSQMVEIFAWDINFYIDTHPGDRWRVVVEKQYLGDKFYRYGTVLAVEYSGRVGTYRAFHWNPTPGKGPGRYYDERGQAIAKSFLKSPLRFVRISSKFDRKRFHPILHRTKAHLGVDYAAPTGTPIWAPSSGRVVEVAMKPGSGNTIVLAHGNGLATRYYHLSRFAPGLKVGRQVRQKEVIGYVGTTGLSTGPHLHFALTKNGAFVDPTQMHSVREAPVADRGAFQAAIRPRLQAWKALAPVAKN